MQNVIGAGKDKPLLLESDAILYSDARARVEARAISEATGMSIAATSILSKLRLLSQPRGESYELLLGAADYVLRGLSGNVGKGFTDATTASTTGLTLPPHRNYDEELLKATHLDAFLPHLPRILPAPMQVGSLSVHAAGALKKPCLAGIPLIHGAGDAYSATVGANSHRPHSGSYTYGGTSGWVGATVSETDRRSISPSVFQLAHGADAGLVLVAASVAAVGGALSHVARMMDVSTGDVAEMAERAPVGANGLVYMPYISGRRCPRRTDVSMGGFLGMRAEHGREEMARAAVEGVVYALAEAGVEGELVQKGVRIVGGVSKSDVFVRGLCAMIGEGRGYVGECDVGIVGAGKIAAGLCGIEVGEEGRWEEVVVGAEACEEWKHGWDRWRRAVDVCDSLAADK